MDGCVIVSKHVLYTVLIFYCNEKPYFLVQVQVEGHEIT